MFTLQFIVSPKPCEANISLAQNLDNFGLTFLSVPIKA